ncbi:ABC transporter permease [Leekyejoonella antrihumi]|uniref:FtsX-like permease family protein n=1 Tax=Leekyejoonella antrihumi TaxID=1660198 RepID=A0A563DUV2_9MICO|nr:ABC transporter permease [Leekyejoonella antrihumi]TWP34025.1 FtsX-like permease family protein [Leekyejoonella antrihumi]
MKRDLVLGSTRELTTVGVVAALAGAYSGVLLTCSTMLTAISKRTGGSVNLLLTVVSVVFIGMALYVAAVVISAGVTTVVAGRLQHIATLRVLGAKSTELRRSVAASTTRICMLGTAIGVVAATGLTDVARVVLVSDGSLPSTGYPWFSYGAPLAVIATTITAAVAGWAGSRGVLEVSPADALSGTTGARTAGARLGRLRITTSAVLVIGGAALFALAMMLGEQGGAAGFLVAFIAACVTSSGLLSGARVVLPALVSTLGRLTGSDAASVIARRNAIADPARTTRSTVGLFVGVSLVVTIASGSSALETAVHSWHNITLAEQHEAHQVLTVATTVTITVGVVSSLIAAIGFVSTMSLTVIQRRREFGLLRALGFTGAQVRSMITKESVAMSAAATAAGVGVGLCYGSAGAQALIGNHDDGFVWGLPWLVLAAIALASLAVILLASQPPARRAIATPPVEALRVDA